LLGKQKASFIVTHKQVLCEDAVTHRRDSD